MPDLSFIVLPHWLYWAGLVAFPLIALYFVRKPQPDGEQSRTRLGVGYLCLLSGGFVGMHRFYVRSLLGICYVIPFVLILYANTQGRDLREQLSLRQSDIASAEFEIEHYQRRINDGYAEQDKLADAQKLLEAAQSQVGGLQDGRVWWERVASISALLIALGLLVDLFRLPKLIAALRAEEAKSLPKGDATDSSRSVAIDLSAEPAFYQKLTKFSLWSGEWVAYWSILAVFVYYYEVIARYIFNSPTNWAHESMFLMFGMQYLISGAYTYLADGHVRVDVFYAKLSVRGKALSDILSSIFFFIFAGALLVTGWTFALDAVQVQELSFTEWAIQYWPVKITIVIGAGLLVWQGLVKLARDIGIFMGGAPMANTPQQSM